MSCETVGYYSQAARGQLEILNSRRAIETLLQVDSIDASLKEKLRLVVSLKAFAAQELGLPDTDNFTSYAALDREHVVWNVFAAPEFSMNPLNWCYPIAGCVSYRGYFKESAALDYAARLSAEGYDVYTGGVDAYSTLGWFNDPVLSTVINRVDYQLAGLIFHELAHQVVYLKGDTTFNESFATAVEREGVTRWLKQVGQSELISAASKSQMRQEQFLELVSSYQDRFSELYEAEAEDSEKRRLKSELQVSLRDDYARIKQQWGGYAGYDDWFENSLNNAQLSTVSSYNQLVPFFESEIAAVSGDMQAFYAAVADLTKLSAEERERRMGRGASADSKL